MTKEQELKDLYAEWFLVVRESNLIQTEYQKALEQLNEATKARIEPVNRKIEEFAQREALLLEKGKTATA